MSDLASSEGSKQQPLLVLGKITQLLNAFTLTHPAMSLRELQAATGLPASTVQRLVASMVGEGILDRAGRRVRIGMRMAYWAAAATKDYDPLTVIHPVLRDLRTLARRPASSSWKVIIACAQPWRRRTMRCST
jgi:DNA-binding IclR family transcriptional regulator